MDMEKVGQAISYLRKRAGYTQKDLADRIGISDKAVSKWERGLSLPDVAYLRKLSILLNTDTDSLLAGAPVFHTIKWRGIIILDDNKYGISGHTFVYDKPLVYFQLSYFLLVGIQNITIVCSEEERRKLSEIIEDGAEYGIKVTYHTGSLHALTADVTEGNIMMVYGKCLLYGVDQTRFFQKAMADKNNITVLVLPKKDEHVFNRIEIDASKRIISANPTETLKMQYEYSALPIIFFPANLFPEIANSDNISESLSSFATNHEMYVELLDRGFVEFELDSWDSIQDASTFLKIIQNRCGMNIYCLEEVAWRRGMITLNQLGKLCSKHNGTEYGAYLSELYEGYKAIEID